MFPNISISKKNENRNENNLKLLRSLKKYTIPKKIKIIMELTKEQKESAKVDYRDLNKQYLHKNKVAELDEKTAKMVLSQLEELNDRFQTSTEIRKRRALKKVKEAKFKRNDIFYLEELIPSRFTRDCILCERALFVIKNSV